MNEGLKIATYKGIQKFGFKQGHTYQISINYEQKKGYSILAFFNITEDQECKCFCPYSSEISIKRDWSFENEE